MQPTMEEVKQGLLEVHGIEDEEYTLKEVLLMTGVASVIKHNGIEVNVHVCEFYGDGECLTLDRCRHRFPETKECETDGVSGDIT